MPREKKMKLFEVMVDGLSVGYVQSYTSSQACKFMRPKPIVTARELGAVEAVGVKEEDVKDATK